MRAAGRKTAGAHEFGFHSQVYEIWTSFGLSKYLGIFEMYFIKDLKL
jgi:hypothetical protein